MLSSLRHVLSHTALLMVLAAAGRADLDYPGKCSGLPEATPGWEPVNFETNLSEITDEDAFTLDCLRNALEVDESYRLILEGYTDRKGTEAWNRRLSKSRAERLRSWLLRPGDIEEGRIDAVGCGVEPNDDGTEARGFRSRMVLIKAFDGSGDPVRQRSVCGAAGTRAPIPPSPGPSDPAGSLIEPCIERAQELISDPGDVDFLLATLPDPIESNFAREFDLFLAALRRALEDAGYAKDRHCLPWTSRLTNGQSEATGASAAESSQPGLMLFQQRGLVGEKVQIVLVIGETPTWGVSHPALHRALDLACGGLDGEPGFGRCRDEIKILGPTFSGSTSGLAKGLAEWLENAGAPASPMPEVKTASTDEIAPPGADHPASQSERGHENGNEGQCPSSAGKIRVLSGTATGTGNAGAFEQALGDHKNLADYCSTAADNHRLQTVLWDQFVRSQLGLDSKDGNGGASIALLQEASVYGWEFDRPGFKVFPFPRNISRLAEEHAKERARLQAAERAEQNSKLPWRSLPLRLGGRRVTRDAIPAFDLEGTTRSVDLVLANLVSAIARERIQLVTIVATNTYDKIFLADYVRSRAPNVRLVTFEGDLLLAHPDYIRSTRGMIVASSNPMVSPEPGKKADFLLQFASDAAQGIYRAASRLVTEPDTQISLQNVKASEKDVWISVVGEDALLPIKKYPRPTGAGFDDLPPRGWSFLFGAASLVAFAALLALFFRLLGRHGLGLHLGDLNWVSPTAESALPDVVGTKRVAFLTVLLLALGAGYMVISLPFLKLEGAAGWVAGALLFLLSAAAFYLLVTLFLRTWIDLRAVEDEDPKAWIERLRRATPLVLTAAAAVFSAFLFSVYFRFDPLLLERSLSFGAGVNPLLPFFLATAVPVSWLLLSLNRFRLLDEITGPGSGAQRGSPAAFSETLDRIRLCINPGSCKPGFGILLLLVPALYIAFYYGNDPSRTLRGLESPWYDRAMTLAYFLAVALCLSSGISSWKIWSQLKRLLQSATELLQPNGGKSWLDACEPSTLTLAIVKKRRREAYASVQRHLASAPVEDSDSLSALSQLPQEAADATESDYVQAWSRIAGWLSAMRPEVKAARLDAEASTSPESTTLAGEAAQLFVWQTAVLARAATLQAIQLMAFMTAGLILLLIGVTAYPFEPRSVLSITQGTLITVGAIASVVILLQIESNKTAAKFTTVTQGFARQRNLLARFGFLAGVPIFSLLASRFPALLEWLQPLLKVMR